MNSLDEDFRNRLLDKFNNDPEWLVVLGKKMMLMRNNAWPQSLIDCVYQYDWHHRPDMCDLWVFLQIYSGLQGGGDGGNYGVFQIPVGCEPFLDKKINENNAVLETLLAPFRGVFWGGTQGADGFIGWEKPVHCTKYIQNKEAGEVRWALVPPMEVKLEVGYNSSGKFWRGINGSRAYARWPYGQKYITIFINFDLTKIYTKDDKEFYDVLTESAETIEQCFEKERSPWKRWGLEVP